MPEIETRIEMYEVDYLCPECGSPLRPTGLCLTVSPPLYPHECTGCDYVENLEKTYPDLRYRLLEPATKP